MDRHDDDETELNPDVESTILDEETHATTGGAAAAGAVTGGVIGLTGGPIGAAIGAVGGAIVGAAAERMMHSDDDAARTDATTINAETDTTLTTSRSTDIGATDRTTTRPTN